MEQTWRVVARRRPHEEWERSQSTVAATKARLELARAQLTQAERAVDTARTRRAVVPLSALGRLESRPSASIITRQGLQRTLDIQAYRVKQPISHLQEDVEVALADLTLPPGCALTQEGEVKQMDDSFERLGLALGLVLLYFSLVPAFRSWLHPLTIMSAIPLALIGASWSMLIANKHGCMPSFMGLILLAGIVVKNSILLIDFIEEARRRGDSLFDDLQAALRRAWGAGPAAVPAPTNQ